ncbi:MAG: MFS transporter, partial [Rhodospirillaceae bacterium]
ARAGVGAGEAALTPAVYSLLAELFRPGRLALAISIFVLAGNIGTGISFILGGSIVQLVNAGPTLSLPGLGEFHGWQIALILTGLPGLIIGGLAFTLPEPRRRVAPVKADPARSYAALFRFVGAHKTFYFCHNVGFALVMGAIVGAASWTPAFFIRTYAWKTGQIGLWLGIAMIASALIGMGIHGTVVDAMFRKGKKDAHLRWLVLMCILGALAAGVAYTAAAPVWTIAFFGLFNMFVMGFSSIGPAALQIVTPKELRGKASSIYFITLMAIGTAGGPSAVAALTDFVFHDESFVGIATAIMVAAFLLTAATLFMIGLKPMREAVPATLSTHEA